jgi:hypothetical protein
VYPFPQYNYVDSEGGSMNPTSAAGAVNWLAVVVAALAGFPLGMLWYGPLFHKPWMAASGVTQEQGRAANPLRLYGTTLLLNLIASTSLAMFIGGGDWRFGLFAGFMTGATFVSMGLGVCYLFEFRTLRHWLINAGYQTLFFSIAGAILGAWH